MSRFPVRSALAAALALTSGWSTSVDDGIAGISNPGALVCARNDAGGPWCTRADEDGRFRITRAETEPVVSAGDLPGTGVLVVYSVDCPAAGRVVDRDARGRNGGAWLDVRCAPDRCVSPPAGLLAWYRFDEAEGAEAADFANAAAPSPLALDGAGHVAGPVLRALGLEGRRAHAHGAADKNVGTGDFSIALWLRFDVDDGNGFRSILDKRDGTPIRGYHIAMHGDQPLLQVADGNGYYNYHSRIPSGLTDGKWHHLAVTVQRASATGVRWYVDGRPAGQVEDARYHPRSLSSDAPLLVGAHSFSGPGRIDGAVDELMIVNRVLAPAEIAALQYRHACR